MIRFYDYSARIQKLTGEVYYPPVVSFSTADNLPFQNSPEASIEVIANENLSGIQNITSIEFDDIIRLSVSIRYHPKDVPVYVNLFEGKVQNISKNYGELNTVTLQCVGHIYEVFDTLEVFGHSWTSTVDAKTIISTLMSESHKLSRVEYDASYVDSGVTLPEFNVEAEKMFLNQVLSKIEEISGYTKYFDTIQIYDRWGILQHIYLTFKSISAAVTHKYEINEGSNRLLAASVDSIGEDVKTFRYVVGGTDEVTGTTYHADVSDSVAVSIHGPRYALDTYSWIMSNSLCTQVAQGLLDGSKDPYVSISCTLEGTPDAHKGDFVKVDFHTLDLKGVAVSGNYRVAKVQHRLSETGAYTTQLDLNRVKMTPTEYTIKYISQKLNNVLTNQA